MLISDFRDPVDPNLSLLLSVSVSAFFITSSVTLNYEFFELWHVTNSFIVNFLLNYSF